MVLTSVLSYLLLIGSSCACVYVFESVNENLLSKTEITTPLCSTRRVMYENVVNFDFYLNLQPSWNE
ncbi:hypothetical protein Y032_0002g900 [Ancylostoma ceylanicum]|uniref:Uncharacterized protein n=1 Tax=Ancylostoma ceylanicum TaxID=53326 RepID=A0A016W2X5_9BILA|nr:hypothetical protein Y032_0002g900 [Ancylostoma ceylanicum]